MSHFSTLIATKLPSESTAVREKAYVTFTCLSGSVDVQHETPRSEPTITLLERRNLISGFSGTGFRTWEAALHLGSYLLTDPGLNLIRNKNVFELGAGTGFLSILCAKYLQAKHVRTTDGDETIVEQLKENFFLNEVDERNASVLRWGRGLKGTWVEEECEDQPYDVVLGSDIVSVRRPLSLFSDH